MKYIKKLSPVIIGVSLIASNITFADTNKPEDQSNEYSIERMIKELKHKGYEFIHEIEMEKDKYEIKGVTDDGRNYKIKVNSKDGHIPELKRMKVMTIEEMIKVLKADGYKEIYKIQLDKKGHYKVTAMNKDNKKVNLTLDGATGAVIKK